MKDTTMDNVQNCDSYINIPSPQRYRRNYLPVYIIFVPKIAVLLIPYALVIRVAHLSVFIYLTAADSV
jgi:hypothetical protein